LNLGIGKEKSEMEFYVFNPSIFSTFNKDSADEYKKAGHIITSTVKVPILPLKDILEKYADKKEIDIMSVDTEGYDMEALNSNDWKKFRPRFIILETLEYREGNVGKKLNDTYDKYMEGIGYKKVADTYINTIYEKSY
jgi:FkbM family methyltransferase